MSSTRNGWSHSLVRLWIAATRRPSLSRGVPKSGISPRSGSGTSAHGQAPVESPLTELVNTPVPGASSASHTVSLPLTSVLPKAPYSTSPPAWPNSIPEIGLPTSVACCGSHGLSAETSSRIHEPLSGTSPWSRPVRPVLSTASGKLAGSPQYTPGPNIGAPGATPGTVVGTASRSDSPVSVVPSWTLSQNQIVSPAATGSVARVVTACTRRVVPAV